MLTCRSIDECISRWMDEFMRRLTRQSFRVPPLILLDEVIGTRICVLKLFERSTRIPHYNEGPFEAGIQCLGLQLSSIKPINLKVIA